MFPYNLLLISLCVNIDKDINYFPSFVSYGQTEGEKNTLALMVFSESCLRGCVSTLDRKGEENDSYFPVVVSYGKS